MKKFLSIILAVVMLVAMVPATFVSAAEGDIVFDFKAFQADSANNGATQSTQFSAVHPENLSLNPNSPNAAWPITAAWQAGMGLRFANFNPNWETSTKIDDFNRVAMDLTVSEDQVGWYRPQITYTANGYANDYMSVYHIYNGVATYLGDTKAITTPAVGAVELKAGTNTFVFCGIGTTNVTFISKLEFVKLASASTISTVTTEGFPTQAINEGETISDLTAKVAMSDGTNFQFPAKAINTTNFLNAGTDTQNYLKIESKNASVVKVTSTKGGMGARDTTTYSLEAVSGGTADIVFTPVVGGVDQTDKAVTKSVTVFSPNIIFDFNTHVAALKNPSANVFNINNENPLPAGLALNASAKSTPVWENRGHVLRFSNVDTASGYGFDVTVPAEKAGMYYTPQIDFGTSNNCAYEVHHIANGKQTYLGDTTAEVSSTQSLKPVKLVEGVNTITFTPVVCSSNGIAMINKISFLKYDGEVPTVASFTADAPASIGLEKTSDSYTAYVTMSDETKLKFPYYGLLSNFTRNSENTQNYIKFEISPADALRVTATKNTIDAPYSEINYTIEALKAGTATLTITPVIAGEAQTALAKTKTIEVIDENIIFDLAAASNAAAAAENFTGASPYFKDDEDNSLISYMPAGFEINNSIGLGLIDASGVGYRWQKGSGIRAANYGAYWETDYDGDTNSSILAFDITIADGREGCYRPKVEFATYQDNAKNVIYVINSNGAQFAGYMTSANSGTLNPVLFEEGKNTLVIACYDASVSNTTSYVKKVSLFKCDEVPTIVNVAVSAPLVLTAKTTGTIEATATMSDGSTFAYEKYAMDPETAKWAGVSTDAKNYIVAASSATAIADVTKTGSGSYRIGAKTDGEAEITVTPYIDGVAQTPIVKSVRVTYPNESLSGTQSIIVDAVVGNGDTYNTAGLIESDDIAIGTVEYPAVGSRVTLTAKSTPALQFLYWYNGNTKKILSEEETYSFDVGTKGAIYAKYADTSDKLTEYASANGQLVKSDYADFGAEPDAEIGTYYEMFVEDFEEEGDEAKAVEKTTESDAFVCWKKDGKIVSYSKTYIYYPWTGTEVVEESTEGEKSTVPAVVLFENGNARMLELVNFDGIEIIEKGILFGASGANVNSYDTKAVSKTDKKQFMATSDLAYARAYVIYKDGTTYRVAYSD